MNITPPQIIDCSYSYDYNILTNKSDKSMKYLLEFEKKYRRKNYPRPKLDQERIAPEVNIRGY